MGTAILATMSKYADAVRSVVRDLRHGANPDKKVSLVDAWEELIGYIRDGKGGLISKDGGHLTAFGYEVRVFLT